MDEGAPSTLSVGFAIDTQDSFGELQQLQNAMNSTEAKVVADATNIERATKGMLNLGSATAQVTAFGNATNRDMATAASAMAKATKAGEAMSAQLQRQIETFGMSKAAARAYYAEQAGNAELAERLRAQEAQLIALREQDTSAMKAQTVAARGLAIAHTGLANGAGLTRIQMLELSHVSMALSSSLLAGINPLRAFAMEMPRVAQAATMGSGGFMGMISAVGAMIAPFAAVAAGAGLLATAFLGVKQAADSADMKGFIDTLGLTDKQIKHLKDTTVTWGDVGKATFQVLAEKAGTSSGAVSSAFGNAFTAIGSFGKFSAAVILASFGAAVKGVADVAMNLPAIISGAVGAAANLGIAALEKMVNLGITGLNKLGSTINSVLGTHFGQIAEVSLGRVTTNLGGTLKAIGADVSGTFHSIYNSTQATFDQISARAVQIRKDALKSEADGILADEAAKKAKEKHTKALKDHNDELEKYLELLNKINANAYFDFKNAKFTGDFNPDQLTKPVRHMDVGGNLLSILPKLPDLSEQYIKSLQAISAQAQETAAILSDSFGKVGDVFGGLLANLSEYTTAQAKLAQEVAAGTTTQMAADQQLATMRERTIGQGISGLKSLFNEHSKGYAVMTAIERAYGVFQAVQTAMAIARDLTHTATSVANSTVRTTANTAEGGSKMFSQLGIYAFPVVAAMVAVIAALGARGSGGGTSGPAIPNVDDLQAKQGAGTVLGDATAKSDSIAHSLDLMSKNTVQGLNYSSEMVRSLRSIDSGIQAMTGNIARDVQVGNLWNTTALKLGTFGSKGFLGIGGSSQLRELADQGIIISTGGPLNLASHYKNQALWNQAMSQVKDGTVAQILANGVYGASYTRTNETNTKSGVFGIGGGTSSGVDYDTSSLSSSITGAFTQVIGSIRNSLVTAANIIGVDGAAALIDAVKVHVGQISFEGMSGSEIEDQLNAVFSSIGDQMTAAISPSLTELQKVGEGLFETFMRVTKDYQTIDAALSSIGMSFGSVGVESLAAREHLIDLAGTLDDFVSQTDYFFNNFFSDADKVAFGQQQITAAFTQLGVAAPATIEQFKALVQSLDLSTDAGASMFEALMQIAPAFHDVQEASQKVADDQAKLQVQLLQAQGRTAEATALQRQIDLQSVDESNRALQLQVWAAQDAAAAAQAAQQLADAWKSVGDNIMDEINRIRGLSDGTSSGTFASLMGQFNAATLAARGGDQDAAKNLPGLSQSLLAAAQNAATSRQELDRIQSEIAASLQATYSLVTSLGGVAPAAPSSTSLITAAATTQAASAASNDNPTADLAAKIAELTDEVAQLRADNNAGHAATAGNTGAIKKALDNVTADSGGNAISTVIAA